MTSAEELEVLRATVAREGGSWLRDVYGHTAALLRPLQWANDLSIRAELRRDGDRLSVVLRARQHRGSVVVALLAGSDPPRIELCTSVDRSKAIVEFRFHMAAGRLAAGTTASLDPAGMAQRSLRALLEALRVDEALLMAPGEAAQAVEAAASWVSGSAAWQGNSSFRRRS